MIIFHGEELAKKRYRHNQIFSPSMSSSTMTGR
jgi:hypothetical protein